MYTIPELRPHSTAASYLSSFWELNKTNLSQRGFADLLNWPASFLPDVIAGRRRLTPSRAVEFSTWAKFNELDTAYMVMLSLSNIENHPLQYFAQSILKTEAGPLLPDDRAEDKIINPIEINYSDYHSRVILQYLELVEGKLNFEKLKKDLAAFSEFQSLEYLKKLLNSLVESKFISGEYPNYVVSSKNIAWKVDVQEQVTHFELIKKCVDSDQTLLVEQGMVTLKRGSLDEFKQRIVSLRNWLLNNCETKPNLENSQLLHVSIFVSEVLSTNSEQK